MSDFTPEFMIVTVGGWVWRFNSLLPVINTDYSELGGWCCKDSVEDEIAYRAIFATGRNFPMVLVVQEILAHEHTRYLPPLAKLGYLIARKCLNVLLPVEQYSRNQKGQSKVPDAQVMSDWMQPSLGQHRQLETSTIWGITGFVGVGGSSGCMQPTSKAGVAWYGRLVG